MEKRKSIAWAYPSSINAEALGMAESGCWHISAELVKTDQYEAGSHIPPYIAHNVPYAEPDDPEMIKLFLDLEGKLCPFFRNYGNKKALAAIGKIPFCGGTA